MWPWGRSTLSSLAAVDPDEYLTFKPFLSRSALSPIIEKKRGDKAIKMIYASDGDHPTRNVPTSKAERAAFVLSDQDILTLSRWACIIEEHYGRPMDMEWAKDGETGELFIVQARPETVQSRREASCVQELSPQERRGESSSTGLAIGEAVVAGNVCMIDSAKDIDRFDDGADFGDANHRPGLGADHEAGGRDHHRSRRAHVARGHRQPRTRSAGHRRHRRRDRVLHDEQDGHGVLRGGRRRVRLRGHRRFRDRQSSILTDIPATRTQMMLNIANPAAAFRWWRLPAEGVGLARMEFVISNIIKIHPMALVHYDDAEGSKRPSRPIAQLTRGYADKTEYFVDTARPRRSPGSPLRIIRIR